MTRLRLVRKRARCDGVNDSKHVNFCVCVSVYIYFCGWGEGGEAATPLMCCVCPLCCSGAMQGRVPRDDLLYLQHVCVVLVCVVHVGSQRVGPSRGVSHFAVVFCVELPPFPFEAALSFF